jgi:Uma2 family endonuclease
MKPVLKFEDLDLTQQYSYADYLTWQFDERVELIDGWIYKMCPITYTAHQNVLTVLNGEIYNMYKNSNIEWFTAPFDIMIFKGSRPENKLIKNVVQPDLILLSDDSKLEDQGCFGTPDLIIEILSPSYAKHDLKIKYALYEENGVKEYWIADPAEKTIMLYELVNNKFQLHKIFFDDDIIESILFKGLKIDVGTAFGLKK